MEKIMMKKTIKHANFYFLLFTFTFLLFNLNGFAQTPIVPPSGLVGWWAGDGNTNDIAGTNNGAFVGDSTFTNFAVGKVGQNFKFQISIKPKYSSSSR